MIRCRACGMDSRTTDFCEWCKKPLNNAPQAQPGLPHNVAAPPTGIPIPASPQSQMPPPTNHAPQMRVSLTGEVIEAPPPSAPLAAPYPQGTAPTQMPGSSPMGHPGGYVPPTAYTPQFLNQQYEAERPAAGERFEKFLAIAMPLLVVSVLLVRAMPKALLGVLIADVILIVFAFLLCWNSE